MMRGIYVILATSLFVLVAVGGLGCARDAADTDEHAEHGQGDYCEEHQIAASQCPYCNPSLVESFGFCVGHSVPEAYCYQCNPALIPAFKSVGDWCAGHDRPESQCYICNPQFAPAAQRESADSAAEPGGERGADTASGGRLSRTEQPPSVECTNEYLLVRFESPEIAEKAGIELVSVASRLVTKTISCNAEVVYDGNRYAHLSAQVPGIIGEVFRDVGDTVDVGDPLAVITSSHLGAAKARLLQTAARVVLWERVHARETDLLARGVSTEKELFEAETRLAESRISLSEAEQALFSFGLSPEAVAHLRQTNDTSPAYTVNAPFRGVIVDRHATAGEVVDSSRQLFAVADVSRMWALIDVYESDLREIRVGQPVVVHVEGLFGEAFAGRLTWVSSQLNPKTRTLRARAELDNEQGLLRANMFAQAKVMVRDQSEALVIPAAAVQWEGCCNIVFVKQSDTVYQPRKVHLGVATGTQYEVRSGVSLGDEVVTQGSFLLKTEIMKGSIGAGCCEVVAGG